MNTEQKPFQAEVRRLLDLVIHSLYSHREIFLRELISNASDAIDRARFEALTHPDRLPAGDGEWKIEIIPNRTDRTLTVRDNGIGMTAEELDQNLGTLAGSGTRRFLEALQSDSNAARAPELIGQFGVGFYSAFMVADRVVVITRRAGTESAWRWESDGGGTYTIAPANRSSPGTDVTLHLREGMDEYLDHWTIRSIVRRYSDYIQFPIILDGQTLNSRKAIWRKKRGEVKEEEYREFYRHLTHDPSPPLRTLHFSAEGTLEFQALLYIPSRPPPDLWLPTRDRTTGLHLYVRNVFITDACQALVPPYLRFLRGVVDSSDLPLNISRETLQDDARIRKIRNHLVNRTLQTLEEMKAREPETYRTFFREFGAVLKEGVMGDPEHHDRLMNLLLFATTAADTPTDLAEAVRRMKPGQKAIYYLVAEDEPTARQSPLLEGFRARGLEVLLLTDPVDAWLEDFLERYQDHPFQPIHRGTIEWPKGPEESPAEPVSSAGEALPRDEVQTLSKALREALADWVKDVRPSPRLTESPCCLVYDRDDLTPGKERVLRALRQATPAVKRILEINPAHPVIRSLEAIHRRNPQDPRFKEMAEILLGQALLAEGQTPPDPVRYARLLADLLGKLAPTD